MLFVLSAGGGTAKTVLMNPWFATLASHTSTQSVLSYTDIQACAIV